ncbi:BTAD domain-containing putative transcriptional regulator [Solwaraspora sp. WMMD406]|uniref:AfsR/SARP family transcriptional regulator n=1 Tax=Solwaraspora sp. WMMD406 TaxID=3016095 RepID=UPI002417561C|nr:BTAD domain-containing putative transcriptional regulator [Solwaraspora sp. WMMD406]MDG4764938.1 BTAD domain-containing putative transcriptional regulator [Solwaraspora sp. WMMD406]
MRVRLLGPVDVEKAGRSLDVGPLQRRAVLAALAVDAGNPVSIDALTERVWGSQAPEAPRSALYAHVARLRRFLATADGDTTPVQLNRHADGYVLDIDRQQVDLHRVGLLAEATRSATASHGDRRIVALREAMDLWRGQPLSNLAGYWAVKVRRSAESQLVSVATAWADEELRLGNAETVAGRLAPIIASNPLAEPLVALQMRALCALGRMSEALQCYAVVRTQISEQLGIEPGPRLRDLHVAVLRGELDGTCTPGIVTTAGPFTAVPRQLPTDVVRFVGRASQLARIHDGLLPSTRAGSTPVAGIYGPAGVGKSALAIHAAHQVADRYPDGQMYLELRGCSVGSRPLSPTEALARLLRTLGVEMPPAAMQVDEAAALFRSLMAGRRMLLVLDNAADASQVRPLLPSGTGCGLLVTSRQPLAGLSDVCQVPVGPLAVAEAVTLLGQLDVADRVAAEPEAAAAVARWCECLPLALRIAAARLVARPGWPLAELRDRLADEHRRLDTLEVDGIGLRASMDGSYQRLSDSNDPTARAAAEAFTVLGACGEPELSRYTAARLLARSEVYAERALERLVDAQLLETSAPGTYRMSELLRLYARERHAASQVDVIVRGGGRSRRTTLPRGQALR